MKKRLGIILIVGILMISTVGLSGCYERPTVTKEFDVYITDAPFGKYWIHQYGRFCLFSGYLNSDLKESFTIKFMNGNELKTLILSSTDNRLHVILTDDNTTMKICIKLVDRRPAPPSVYELEQLMLLHMNSKSPGNGWFEYTFTLYIPKPEICQISDEVIE